MWINYYELKDVYTKSSLGTLKDVPVVFVSGVPGAGNKTASEYLSTMTGFVSIFPGDLERNLDPSTENDETVAKALKENKILPEVSNLYYKYNSTDYYRTLLCRKQLSSGLKKKC